MGKFLFAAAVRLKLFVGRGCLMAYLAFEGIDFSTVVADCDYLGLLDGNKGLIDVKRHLK